MRGDPNISVVELAVEALGTLTDELVLVGGCSVGLLVTDLARTPVRQTIDVDLLIEVAVKANYFAFCDRLRSCGFHENPTEEVICRWSKGSLLIDVMPTQGEVLGFTNSWYAQAAREAHMQTLPSGNQIRVISAPLFIATKLEAFASRGNGDFLHHDLEDIVTIVDGRESVLEEIDQCDDAVKSYIRDEFDSLLAVSQFVDRLSWLLPQSSSPERQQIVLGRFKGIAGL